MSWATREVKASRQEAGFPGPAAPSPKPGHTQETTGQHRFQKATQKTMREPRGNRRRP